jgi:hypothetical protein
MTTIRYATEADAPAIAELNIICFQDAPMYRNMFPNIDPLSATPMKISRTFDKLKPEDAFTSRYRLHLE